MPNSDLQITFGADASGVVKGAADAKTAVAGVAPNVTALGKSFADLADKVKSGFDGLSATLQGLKTAGAAGADAMSALTKAGDGAQAVKGLAGAVSGLKVAGAAGAEGLAALAEVGGGVTTVVAAIGGVALSAAGALTDWAQRTQQSTTASAAARQSAAALMTAMNAAGGAFSQVGDTLGAAFAPALTTVVDGLTSLATAFESSYNSGGMAKTAVDELVAGLQLLVAAVEEVITWWKTEIDVVSGAGRNWADALGVAGTAVVGLWDKLTNTLQPVFQAVSSAAQTAWKDIQDAFGVLVDAVKTGYQDWKALNAPLVDAIKLIAGGVASIEKPISEVISNIIGWFDKLFEAVLRFLNALPGVSAAMEKLKSQAAASDQTDLNDVNTLFNPSASQHPTPPPAPPPPPRSSTNGSQQNQTGGAQGAAAPSAPAAACPTDDCAAKTKQQSDQTTATLKQAGDDRVQDAQASDTQTVIAATDASGEITEASVASGLAQVAAGATSTDQQIAQIGTVTTAAVASDDTKARSAKKSADEAIRAWQGFDDRLVSSFTSGLEKMAEGTKSLAQVVRGFGQQVLNDVLRVIDQSVEKWLWGETEKVLATTQGQQLLQALGLKDLAAQVLVDARKTVSVEAGAAAQTAAQTTANSAGLGQLLAQSVQVIKADAAKVFGNVFAALTSNPVTAPAAGPVAAAAAATVVGFSGAGGFDVPAGVNPITQLHQQEMVLPARLANPMRDMLAGYASGGTGSGAGHSISFGDFHVHGAPGGMSSSEFRQALGDHAEHVAGAVAGALRGGWKPSYKNPTGLL